MFAIAFFYLKKCGHKTASLVLYRHILDVSITTDHIFFIYLKRGGAVANRLLSVALVIKHNGRLAFYSKDISYRDQSNWTLRYHWLATDATLLRKELYCPGVVTRRSATPIRYMVRRYTQSIMKDLIWVSLSSDKFILIIDLVLVDLKSDEHFFRTVLISTFHVVVSENSSKTMKLLHVLFLNQKFRSILG